MHCTASNQNSPWHNFVSDEYSWIDENGEIPCQNDKLFPQVGADIPFIASLNEAGAKKIWNHERIATLDGSPMFARGISFCSENLTFVNVG